MIPKSELKSRITELEEERTYEAHTASIRKGEVI